MDYFGNTGTVYKVEPTTLSMLRIGDNLDSSIDTLWTGGAYQFSVYIRKEVG